MQTKNQRAFTSYESNQLLKYGIQPTTILSSDTRPVEYITHAVCCQSHEFYVDEKVLIPRVETEDLIDLVVSDIKKRLTSQIGESNLIIVDVGTGSGIIGLLLWLISQDKFPKKQLDFFLIDISQDALVIAKKNYQHFKKKYPNWENKVHFLLSDLLKSWDSKRKIDIIIANLPYIPTSRLRFLDASVKDHEPLLALDGGADGLRLINQLIEQAGYLIKPGGSLWLEIDDSHAAFCFKNQVKQRKIKFFHDSFRKNRFIRLSF